MMKATSNSGQKTALTVGQGRLDMRPSLKLRAWRRQQADPDEHHKFVQCILSPSSIGIAELCALSSGSADPRPFQDGSPFKFCSLLEVVGSRGLSVWTKT